MKNFAVLFLIFTILSCKENSETKVEVTQESLVSQKIEYAEGLSIDNHKTFKEIKVSSAWPDADEFSYILYPKGSKKPKASKNAIFIEVPVERLVVTSTTDIPMLEFLNSETKLVGFPHTDYISSEKTRSLIDHNKIKELGKERNLNTEIVLELDPDLIIGFSATGDTKSYDLIEKTGIPVVMNGSWTEQHPLGRAEWIKFIAAFLGKEKEAKTIFDQIKNDYNTAIDIAKNATTKPTVLSGGLFKDVWYTPGGKSYVARFLEDANTNYLWKETDKTGSLALSFESVLEKGQNAELWIGPGSSNSLAALAKKNHKYKLFNAFKNENIYSSTLKMGDKGGLLYYELGPMRPDLILKDIIKIAHPDLLKNYELYFFEKLQ